MMVVSLLAAAVVLASLPAALRRGGRRLGPAEWAWLCLIAMVASVILGVGALLIWSAPAVLSAVGLGSIATICDDMLGPLALGGRWAGIAAGVAAMGLMAVMAHTWRDLRDRSQALWIEPWLGQHETRDDFELVVLPTDEPIAYSVTHPGNQVVISEGLARRLRPGQLEVVVAHERAHLDKHHGVMLRAAAIAAAGLRWWPPAARSHLTTRIAIERWADEVATHGDRQGRRALRDALLDVAMFDVGHGVAALSLAAATAERVESLERDASDASRVRLGMYLPGALVATGVVATIVSCIAVTVSSMHAIHECCVL